MKPFISASLAPLLLLLSSALGPDRALFVAAEGGCDDGDECLELDYDGVGPAEANLPLEAAMHVISSCLVAHTDMEEADLYLPGDSSKTYGNTDHKRGGRDDKDDKRILLSSAVQKMSVCRKCCTAGSCPAGKFCDADGKCKPLGDRGRLRRSLIHDGADESLPLLGADGRELSVFPQDVNDCIGTLLDDHNGVSVGNVLLKTCGSD